MRHFAAIALLFAVAGCGGAHRSNAEHAGDSSTVSTRAATPADAVLTHLPLGADVLIEVDLSRARDNQVVGGLATQLFAGDSARTSVGPLAVPLDDGAAPLASATALVLAAYAVGTADAAMVTVVRGGAPGKNALDLGDGWHAVGPPALLGQVAAVSEGSPSLATDADLLSIRARAMPKAATGAVIRATARLTADARITLANQLGLEQPPRALSLWFDVVDDAALVIDVDGHDDGDATAVTRLRTTLERKRASLAKWTPVALLGLSPALERSTITTAGTWLHLTTVVNPDRLHRVIDRAQRALDDLEKAAVPTTPATTKATSP